MFPIALGDHGPEGIYLPQLPCRFYKVSSSGLRNEGLGRARLVSLSHSAHYACLQS